MSEQVYIQAGLVLLISAPIYHQRNDENYTGYQKYNTADKVQDITTYDG